MKKLRTYNQNENAAHTVVLRHTALRIISDIDFLYRNALGAGIDLSKNASLARIKINEMIEQLGPFDE